MALSSGKHGLIVVHGTEGKLPRGEFLAKVTNSLADALLESPIQCLAPGWQKNSPYRLLDIVRPPTENGFLYVCTKAGQSGSDENLTWPTKRRGKVKDGSVVWRVQLPGD